MASPSPSVLEQLTPLSGMAGESTRVLSRPTSFWGELQQVEESGHDPTIDGPQQHASPPDKAGTPVASEQSQSPPQGKRRAPRLRSGYKQTGSARWGDARPASGDDPHAAALAAALAAVCAAVLPPAPLRRYATSCSVNII